MSDEKYRAILEKDPTDTQAFVALCDSAERNNDYQYLAQLYDFRAQVIADTKEIADLYFKSGEIYLDKLGQVPEGVASLLKGFESDRTHAGIGDRLDAVYREAEDWESAVQIIEQRLEALTGADVNGTKTVIRSDLHQQAGEIWEKVYTDRKKALSHYKRAIELDKTNLLALYGAREIYYQAGKFKNASKLGELEARAEKDPQRRAALYRELAQIYEKNLQKVDHAVIALKRALKATPQSTDIQSELARLIAMTPHTEESAKDHLWAAEYLLRSAASAPGAAAVDFASLAVISAPLETKALDFLEDHARETGNFVQLTATLEEILSQIPDARMRNPVLERLASVYRSYLKDEERAEHWQSKMEPTEASPPATADEPREFVPVDTDAPPAPQGDDAPPAVESAPAEPEQAEAPVSSAPVPHAPAAIRAPVEETPQQQTPVAEAPVAQTPAPIEETPISEAPAASPVAAALPPREPGMSDESFAEVLRQASDRARRVGDDPSAELCLLHVLELFPYDQKAVTFLERRFRARSDWSSLRDLLLRSAGSPHLPLAVQTVRLREAARLSEDQLGDIDGAIRAWSQIKQNDPKVRDAVDALIRLLEQAASWGELEAILKQEVETTKSRTKKASAYRKLAEIYHLRTDDLESAADAYRQVLELLPEDQGAIETLEEIYQRTEKYDEVVGLLQKRADLTSNRAEKRDFLFRSAQVLRENLSRMEDAYAQAKEVLVFSKDDPEVLAFLTALDEEGGHWSRLMNVLDIRIHSSSSDEEKVQLLRKKASCAVEKLGDTQIAVQTLKALMALSKEDIEAMDSLIEIYRQTGDWDALVQILQTRISASADRSEQAELYRECGRVLEEQLGKSDDAAACWKAILEIEPDAETLGALADYYEKNQQWDAFIDIVEQRASYVEDLKERATVLFRRVLTLKDKLNDREKAIAELDRIVKEVDPSHDESLDLLTDMLVEDGRFPEAAELLEQRISYSSDKEAVKAMLLTLGGWCTDELNDKERAMNAYERAVQLDKDDSVVLDALDDVYTALSEWDKLLKLLYARAKVSSDDDARLSLLLRGATVCEESMADKKKAWTWHIEILDKLGHMEKAVEKVEEAARRMELWKELIDLAGVMTKKAKTASDQVEWWLKAADIFEEKMIAPGQALEAVLRAFGLEPDNESLLDRVDRLAVGVENWQRLAGVYGVLVNRLTEKAAKVEMLTRYAKVLRDKAGRFSDAFEISVRAFELDPESETLLQMVEELGKESKRWNDMVRIYNGCASLADDTKRKAEMKFRAAFMLRDEKRDPDSAAFMILDALCIDPLDEDLTADVWKEIENLESDLIPSEAGSYWNRLVEMYRALADKSENDPERCFALLCKTSDVYIEKLKDTNAAFEVLKENQTVNPKDERNLDKLESLAEENDAWQALANHYQDVLDETFDMEVAVMLHRRRGRILQEKLNRPEDAAEHFWQIIQLDSSDAQAYSALISYYESSKKWNDLVNLLERRLDNTSDEDDKCSIFMQIGEIWEKEIGNRYEAKDWYDQILALRPDDEAATSALERLTQGDTSRVAESALQDDDDTIDEDEDMQALISIPPPSSTPETEEETASDGEEETEEAAASDDEEDETDSGDIASSFDTSSSDEIDDEAHNDSVEPESREEPRQEETEPRQEEDASLNEEEDSDIDEPSEEPASEDDDSPPPPPAAVMPAASEQNDAPWPVLGGDEDDALLDSPEETDDELLIDDDEVSLEEDDKS